MIINICRLRNKFCYPRQNAEKDFIVITLRRNLEDILLEIINNFSLLYGLLFGERLKTKSLYVRAVAGAYFQGELSISQFLRIFF